MPRPYTRHASKKHSRRFHRRREIARIRDSIQRLKGDTPCLDCGMCYPWYVMQFDHVRGVKRHDLSKIAKCGRSWSSLEAEIAKCDIVCANCHAARTYSRKHNNGRTDEQVAALGLLQANGQASLF